MTQIFDDVDEEDDGTVGDDAWADIVWLDAEEQAMMADPEQVASPIAAVPCFGSHRR